MNPIALLALFAGLAAAVAGTSSKRAASAAPNSGEVPPPPAGRPDVLSELGMRQYYRRVWGTLPTGQWVVIQERQFEALDDLQARHDWSKPPNALVVYLWRWDGSEWIDRGVSAAC